MFKNMKKRLCISFCLLGLIFAFSTFAMEPKHSSLAYVQELVVNLREKIKNIIGKINTLRDSVASISQVTKKSVEPQLASASVESEAEFFENIEPDIPANKLLKRFLDFRSKAAAEGGVEVLSTRNLESFLVGEAEYEALLKDPTKIAQNPIREKLAKMWIRNAAVRVFADPLRSFLEIVVNACDAMLSPEKGVGKFGMGFFSILSFLRRIEGEPQAPTLRGTTITIDSVYRSPKHPDPRYCIAVRMGFGLKQDLSVDLKENDISIKFKMLRKNTAEFNDLIGGLKDVLVGNKEIEKALNTSVRIYDKKAKKHTKVKPETIFPTGTIVSITPVSGVFSDQTLEILRSYVQQLQFFTNARVALFFKTKDAQDIEYIGGPIEKTAADLVPTTYVWLDNSCLRIADVGTGMSPEIALLKLLIPSTSTKGTQELAVKREQILKQSENPLPDLQDVKAKQDTESHFVITVNGISVIDKKLSRPFVREGKKDVVLSMPQVTQLTLARDELEVSPDGKSFEEKYLKKTIDQMLTQALKPGQQKLTDVLLPLYQGLESWEKQSAAQHIQGRFTGFFKEKLDEHAEHFIPAPEQFTRRVPLIQGYKKPVVELDDHLVDYNFSALEDELTKFFDQMTKPKVTDTPVETLKKEIIALGIEEKLISGIKVFFVSPATLPLTDPSKAISATNQPIIDTIGLRTSLFVSEAVLDEIINDAITQTQPQKQQELAVENVCKHIASRTPMSDYRKFGEKENAAILLISNMPEKIKSPVQMIKEFVKLKSPNTTYFFWGFTSVQNWVELADSFKLFDSDDSDVAKEFLNKYITFFVDDSVFCKVYQTGRSNSPFIFSKAKLAKYKDGIFFYRTESSGAHFFYDENTQKFFNLLLLPEEQYVKLISAVLIKGEEPIHFFNFETGDYQNLEPKSDISSEAMLNIFFEWFFCNLWAEVDSPNWEYPQDKIFFRSLKSSPSKIESIKNSVIYVGNKKIWPLKEKDWPSLLSEDKIRRIEDCFFYLYAYYLRDQTNPPENSVTAQELNEIRLNAFAAFKEILNKAHRTDLLFLAVPSVNIIFASLPGYNEQDLQLFIQKASQDFTWANTISGALSEKFENLSVEQTLCEMLAWYITACFGDNKVNPWLAVMLNKFKESLLGIYSKYFTIPNSFFPIIYGQAPSRIAQYPDPDCQGSEMIALLKMFEQIELHRKGEGQKLFKKLVIFTLADLVYKTDAENQKEDLASQQPQIYMPSVMNNTPLSLLAVFKAKGLNDEIIKLILGLSRNYQELAFVCHALLQPTALDVIKTSQTSKQEEVKTALELIIKNYVQEKVDKIVIEELYIKTRKLSYEDQPTTWNLKERIVWYGKNSAVQAIGKFLSDTLVEKTAVVQTEKNYPPELGTYVPTTASFTLKQIIRAHCSGQGLKAGLDNGELDTVREAVVKQKKEFDINKIAQCVEAGSERAPVQATLIECIQNSIDVIKGFFKDKDDKSPSSAKAKKRHDAAMRSYEKRKEIFTTTPAQVDEDLCKIECNLEVLGSKQLVLTIRDFVGFPDLTTFLSDFLLPDYSNKSPEEGNVGDMGNGTFKMYQHAESVCLLTRTLADPDKCYLLIIKPKIDNPKVGLIDNLNIQCELVTPPADFFGTSIRLIFKESDQVLADVLATKDFMLNCLGATQVKIDETKNVLIYYAPENKLLNPVAQLKDTVCDIERYHVHVKKRENELLQSYILTNGVPFLPLAAVARELNLLPLNFISTMSTGYTVNLDLGTYAPVQSRTHLQLLDGGNGLRRSLCDAFYKIGLDIVDAGGQRADDFLSHNFTNFKSHAPLDQVGIGKGDAEIFEQEFNQKFLEQKEDKKVALRFFRTCNFFDFYRPVNGNHKSFYDYIHEIYTSLSAELDLRDKLDFIKNSLENGANATLKQKQEELKTACSKENPDIKSIREAFAKEWKVKRDEWDNAWKKGKLDIIKSWESDYQKHYPCPKEDAYGLITRVVIPWVEPKADNLIIKFPNEDDLFGVDTRFKTKEEKQKEDDSEKTFKYTYLNAQNLKDIKSFLNKILLSYCNNFFLCLGKQPSEIGTILKDACFYFDNFSPVLGFYNRGSCELKINLNYVSVVDLLDFGATIAKYKQNAAGVRLADITSHSIYKQLFSPKRMPSATVIHELYHVKQLESSMDVTFHPIDFEEKACEQAAKALCNGLLEKWFMEVNTAFAPIQSVYDFQQQLNQLKGLHDFEKTYKKDFMKKLKF